MSRRSVAALLLCGLILVGIVAGCEHKSLNLGDEGTPSVLVSQPVSRLVTNFEEFTGRTDAVESVDVKARVTGYLFFVGFRPGAEVRGEIPPVAHLVSVLGLVDSPFAPGPLLAVSTIFPGWGNGDLLFVIDPRPYRAQFDQGASQVQLAEAQLKLAKANYARALELAKTPGAISQQEIDKYEANRDEAVAQVAVAKANLESYLLNLEFTRVTAPISGKISRNYLTNGNVVNKDETLLTTIVSEDPMFAYFDVDERTMLNVQQAVREGKIKPDSKGQFPVFLGLANEIGFPHAGFVDFLNNKVDPNTGTLTVRAVFPNPKPEVGPRPLLPGEFVRVRLPLGQPTRSLLVAEQAITSEQGQKYLLIVDDKDVVKSQRVKLGALQDDGLRVIEEGLEGDEWVIVSGLQLARRGAKVVPERVPMPTKKGPAPSAVNDKAQPGGRGGNPKS